MNNFAFVYLENHIIGCGENSVSMWNHQTGGLVINIDMNIATIGDNLGGLLMDVNVS